MLNVKNIQVAYGESTVINDLSFSANKNETIAIMGRNGMGKTTLFKSLIGVLPINKGNISIDGDDLSFMQSFERVYKGVAYVPQGRMDFSILNSTREYRNRVGIFKE